MKLSFSTSVNVSKIALIYQAMIVLSILVVQGLRNVFTVLLFIFVTLSYDNVNSIGWLTFDACSLDSISVF